MFEEFDGGMVHTLAEEWFSHLDRRFRCTGSIEKFF